jgi:hypothetical protein
MVCYGQLLQNNHDPVDFSNMYPDEQYSDKINHSLQPLPMQCLSTIEYKKSEAAVELFGNIKLIKMIINISS